MAANRWGSAICNLPSGTLKGGILKSSQLAKTAAQAADEKKAKDIVVLDVARLLVITDYFMICSGNSNRQVRTISENIRQKLAKKGIRPLGVEGEEHADWVLLDYGDLVIHIFTEEQREYYQLERLWRDAPVLDWDSHRVFSSHE